MQVLNGSFHYQIFNVLPLGGHQDHLGFEALSPSGQSRAQMNHRQELYEVVTKILKSIFSTCAAFSKCVYDSSMQGCGNQQSLGVLSLITIKYWSNDPHIHNIYLNV